MSAGAAGAGARPAPQHTDTPLCVHCGLCCDGSLFTRAALTEAERTRLGDRVESFERDGKLRLRQPCRQLDAQSGCACYADRPQVCRDYACRLLKRVQAGQLPEAAARTAVDEVRHFQRKAQQKTAEALSVAFDPGAATLSQGIRQMRQAIRDGAPHDSYAARAAETYYEIHVALVRLHIKPDFRDGKARAVSAPGSD